MLDRICFACFTNENSRTGCGSVLDLFREVFGDSETKLHRGFGYTRAVGTPRTGSTGTQVYLGPGYAPVDGRLRKGEIPASLVYHDSAGFRVEGECGNTWNPT